MNWVAVDTDTITASGRPLVVLGIIGVPDTVDEAGLREALVGRGFLRSDKAYQMIQATSDSRLQEVIRSGAVRRLPYGVLDSDHAAPPTRETGRPMVEPILVDEAQMERLLEAHPTVDLFLGNLYRRLAAQHALTVNLTPLDWDATEALLADIASRVEGICAHWQQNPQGGSVALLTDLVYSTLAEIEGFAYLLTKPWDRVCALPHEGGKTPDACCWNDGRPHLYEIKSLWAHLERRTRQLVPLPGTATFHFAFGRRRDGPYWREGQHNRRVVRETLRGLLDKAAAQLTAHAARKGYHDSPMTILLVVTQREPLFAFMQTPKELAQRWHDRHRHAATSVKWVPS